VASANGVLAFEKNRQDPGVTVWSEPIEAFMMRLESVQLNADVNVPVELNRRALESEFARGFGVCETDGLPAIVLQTYFDHRKIEHAVRDNAAADNDGLRGRWGRRDRWRDGGAIVSGLSGRISRLWSSTASAALLRVCKYREDTRHHT